MGVLDHVGEFADVAGPGILAKKLGGIARKGLGGFPIKIRLDGQKMLSKRNDVVGPLSQWRNVQDNDVQTKIQVFTESALAHHRGEIAVSRTNDANIHGPRLGIAHGNHATFLKHAKKFGLKQDR